MNVTNPAYQREGEIEGAPGSRPRRARMLASGLRIEKTRYFVRVCVCALYVAPADIR